jgi:hypothetical protein
MRRRTVSLLLLLLLTAAWQIQVRAYSSSSTAEAVVNYKTELAVAAVEPKILIDFSGTGTIDCEAEFDVAANTSEVQMYIEATDLHFEKDHPKVTAIPLNTSAGAKIDPVGAEGATRTAGFLGPGSPIDGLETYQSQKLSFTSPDSLTFNHQVFVSVEWNQENLERPAGKYTAKIKLVCFIEP